MIIISRGDATAIEDEHGKRYWFRLIEHFSSVIIVALMLEETRNNSTILIRRPYNLLAQSNVRDHQSYSIQSIYK